MDSAGKVYCANNCTFVYPLECLASNRYLQTVADVAPPSPLPTPRSPHLSTLEKVDVGELLHVVDVRGLDDLLIVEQDPADLILIRDLLADKCNVVTRTGPSAHFYTYNGWKKV